MRCFTLRRFERYPESWRSLDSNHCTVDCTHGTRTPGNVVFNTIFFVFKIKILKKCKKCMNQKENDLKKNCKNPEGEVIKPLVLRDKHNIGGLLSTYFYRHIFIAII